MSASSGNPYFDMPGGTKQLGLFLQDDWKVTQRLSLNLGVRWDKDFNLIGASAIAGSRTFQELQAIGSPFAKLPDGDDHDFSPRIGFAYDLKGDGRQVVPHRETSRLADRDLNSTYSLPSIDNLDPQSYNATTTGY
jgi:outer membrane receptor protein involved in Fe transport